MSAGKVVRGLRHALARAWQALRLWSGDAAYDVYAARGTDAPRLDRRAFYLDSLKSRYRRPNRCC